MNLQIIDQIDTEEALKIKLAEEFLSIQGEGHLVGKVQYFVRFGICKVIECPIRDQCDTNYNVTSTDTPENIANRAFGALGKGGWTCITGGEPCDQADALRILGIELYERGMKIAIQTSGTRRVPIKWDWLTVSPKCGPQDLLQRFGQELKLVYTGQSLDEIAEFYNTTKYWDYYLQPLWQDGEEGFRRTAETVIKMNTDYGQDWKLSMQMHKFAGLQ